MAVDSSVKLAYAAKFFPLASSNFVLLGSARLSRRFVFLAPSQEEPGNARHAERAELIKIFKWFNVNMLYLVGDKTMFFLFDSTDISHAIKVKCKYNLRSMTILRYVRKINI